MKKVHRIKEIFSEELPKHNTNNAAFNSANNIFQEQTGLNGYSSYNSYLVVIKKTKD